MILHTCNKTFAGSGLDLCLRALQPGDTLLLLEDGVYALVGRPELQSLHENVRLCALEEDLAARGISDKIPPAVTRVGYREFVALCLEHDRVVNWV